MPVSDAWTVRLEVAAPTLMEPGLPAESREQWLDAGVKGFSLVDFKYSTVAERDYWPASEIDQLVEFSTKHAIPWLRRMQQLEEARTFYERALIGCTKVPASDCLDDSALITLFHESSNRLLLNKNLGLVCYWQNDYAAALHYLSDYTQALFDRFKAAKNPEMHDWNVRRLKMAQNLVDKISTLCKPD